MKQSKTVKFDAQSLHSSLDVLFLRKLQSKQDQPALCRVSIAEDTIRLATVFYQGAAGIKALATAMAPFECAISATRIESLRHMDGDVKLTIGDNGFRYTTAGGGSGSGATYAAALVPEVELPPVLGTASATSLQAILELCVPFAGGSIRRRGASTAAGDAQRSITIDCTSREPDWVIGRDASPAVREYLKLVGGEVKLLGNEAKFGFATEHTWFVWPRSVLPEVPPLRPVAEMGSVLIFDTKSISNSVGALVSEVGEDAWFDLSLKNGEARLSWSHGDEFCVSGVMSYEGVASHPHLRLHGLDLGVLFRRVGRDQVSLALETRGATVALTSSETVKIGGERATVHRSVLGHVGE